MNGERDANKAWEEDGEGHCGVREREPERKENGEVSFNFPQGMACFQFQTGHVQGCA